MQSIMRYHPDGLGAKDYVTVAASSSYSFKFSFVDSDSNNALQQGYIALLGFFKTNGSDGNISVDVYPLWWNREAGVLQRGVYSFTSGAADEGKVTVLSNYAWASNQQAGKIDLFANLSNSLDVVDGVEVVLTTPVASEVKARFELRVVSGVRRY